jgi:hypothetical protein
VKSSQKPYGSFLILAAQTLFEWDPTHAQQWLEAKRWKIIGEAREKSSEQNY